MLKQPNKKQRRNQVVIAASAGVAALMLGAAVSSFGWLNSLKQLPPSGWMNATRSPHQTVNPEDRASKVLPLISRPVSERAAELEAIATGKKSLDQSRARYLLASDLIQQGQGGQALPLLEGLEQDYSLLAPLILAKRAQAYTASSQSAKANEAWKQLLQRYPDSPIAAEALFALGKSNPAYWDQAIQKFPAHPRSVEIAQMRLKQNPRQLPMLLALARYGLHLKNSVSVLDRLTTEYASSLRPEDWEAIAFGYWEHRQYGKAGSAYEKAPHTPLHLYRAGRGAHLSGQGRLAIDKYHRAVQAYPTSEEAATALLRLASLTDSHQTAIAYLDRVPTQFPEKVAEALLAKAEHLEASRSPQSASVIRRAVLTQYSNTEAAAEFRWTQAEQRVAAGDIKNAWQWAREIVKENPESEYAPEAAFWVGKWAYQIGYRDDSRKAFEYVLAHYPESYYAWRSASLLGWDVGDFTTVRQHIPDVVKPAQRPMLPAGSALVQELYRLGQEREAWSVWQVDFKNRVQPTVAEQFTDGVMRLGVGDNLEGIFMVSSLENREKPAEKEEYRALKQNLAYWQALYPFPFVNPIEHWATQRQLNPMLVTALIRQESRFEPAIESSAGATGLMQVMPGTAEWVAQQIGMPKYTITEPNDNIALGTWYLDYTHREYANNSLFAVASYNAGPGNVADWINRFGFSDPDLFIEKIPFSETKGYVESVFANYWNYLRIYNPDVSRKLAEHSAAHSAIVQASAK